MLTYLYIALGGAIGSVARFWVASSAAQRWSFAFPYGTLAVNVTGSFLIGILAAFTSVGGRIILPQSARAFLMIGICGGYTTFSAFSLETLLLARDGEWLRAIAYVFLSVILCFIAVGAGYFAASFLNKI